MRDKENSTKNELKLSESKSIIIDENEIQPLEYQALSEMLNKDENQPENLLIDSARRMTNLAHSLMESRLDAYLENDKNYPVISSCVIDDIVKLSLAANDCMKTVLVYKKEKIDMLKKIKGK